MTRNLTRRNFLGALAGAAASLALPRSLWAASDEPGNPERGFNTTRPASVPYWGIITGWTPVRVVPAPSTDLVGQLSQGAIIPLLGMVEGEAPPQNPNNNRWYRTAQGYIYTATVHLMQPYRQPIEVRTMPEMIIDEEPGFWAEVIVPETPAREEPSGAQFIADTEEKVVLSHSSVHRVIEIETDDAGFIWYKLHNDKKGEDDYYALARHMRYLSPAELAPIHPEAANKRIEVNLAAGRIDCFEGDALVMSTLTSSGADGWNTPRGEWAVVYKQPSRRMHSGDGSAASGGDSDQDAFDLPGVPFCTFFTTQGHAIHGTWWHGDYGHPRSHGCLNVPSDLARWIWRWVTPEPRYDLSADGSSAEPGTPVRVI